MKLLMENWKTFLIEQELQGASPEDIKAYLQKAAQEEEEREKQHLAQMAKLKAKHEQSLSDNKAAQQKIRDEWEKQMADFKAKHDQTQAELMQQIQSGEKSPSEYKAVMQNAQKQALQQVKQKAQQLTKAVSGANGEKTDGKNPYQLENGCHPGKKFSGTTGEKCPTDNSAYQLENGCIPGKKFSGTTGEKCP